MLPTTLTADRFSAMSTDLWRSIENEKRRRWCVLPRWFRLVYRGHTLLEASVESPDGRNSRADGQSFDSLRKRRCQRKGPGNIHDKQDLSIRSRSIRRVIRDLHRPHRSTVMRSKHDLQKLCWHGSCSGSWKISKQIGLKEKCSRKKQETNLRCLPGD